MLPHDPPQDTDRLALVLADIHERAKQVCAEALQARERATALLGASQEARQKRQAERVAQHAVVLERTVLLHTAHCQGKQRMSEPVSDEAQ